MRAGLLDMLLPQRCVACGGGEELLCDGCRAGLLRLGAPLCARCGAPTAWPVERCAECAGRRISFASARAGVAYEGVARLLVAAWKERGMRTLATLAAEIVAGVVWPPPVEVLTFVPADADRHLWRGTNPAEGLAADLAARWQLPVRPLLERARSIPRQRGLSRAARRANVRAAFRGVPQTALRVGLVDDVYTTGATVDDAARELRRAGARAVHVVTFARASRR